MLMSATSHRPRAITPARTAALALLAALITVWLHLVAQFGAAAQGGAAGLAHRVPDRLGVVRIAPGETLRQLAARVAPDAPSGQVAQRIRELNDIGTATPTAGQTLIVPVG
jgi:predicted Zn-dependent protease